MLKEMYKAVTMDLTFFLLKQLAVLRLPMIESVFAINVERQVYS